MELCLSLLLKSQTVQVHCRNNSSCFMVVVKLPFRLHLSLFSFSNILSVCKSEMNFEEHYQSIWRWMAVYMYQKCWSHLLHHYCELKWKSTLSYQTTLPRTQVPQADCVTLKFALGLNTSFTETGALKNMMQCSSTSSQAVKTLPSCSLISSFYFIQIRIGVSLNAFLLEILPVMTSG